MSRYILGVFKVGAFAVLVALAGCGSDENAQFNEARDLFLEASSALQSGDSAKAIEAFTKCIEVMPSAEAYMERAKLYAEANRQEDAMKDCEAALEFSPENPDVLWLIEELKKPKEKRFQGKTAEPPSRGK